MTKSISQGAFRTALRAAGAGAPPGSTRQQCWGSTAAPRHSPSPPGLGIAAEPGTRALGAAGRHGRTEAGAPGSQHFCSVAGGTRTGQGKTSPTAGPAGTVPASSTGRSQLGTLRVPAGPCSPTPLRLRIRLRGAGELPAFTAGDRAGGCRGPARLRSVSRPRGGVGAQGTPSRRVTLSKSGLSPGDVALAVMAFPPLSLPVEQLSVLPQQCCISLPCSLLFTPRTPPL